MIAMLQASLLALSLYSLAIADWGHNLNFRSPSRSHNLGIALSKVQKRHDGRGYQDPQTLAFTHGTASGDPYSSSVILWTRIAPTFENDRSNTTVSGTVPLYDHTMQEYALQSRDPVCVDYFVSTNPKPNAGNAVSNGRALTSSDIDFTVKVEVTGLSPWTRYYYRFAVCNSDNWNSIGRTVIAPGADDDVTMRGASPYSYLAKCKFLALGSVFKRADGAVVDLA